MEILNYLQDAAGSRNLVFDLAVTHDRYGSSAQPHHNGLLTHPQDLDAPLHVAARKKINAYRDQYAERGARDQLRVRGRGGEQRAVPANAAQRERPAAGAGARR